MNDEYTAEKLLQQKAKLEAKRDKAKLTLSSLDEQIKVLDRRIQEATAREALQKTFFEEKRSGKTLQQIGDEHGVPKERVRQWIAKYEARHR